MKYFQVIKENFLWEVGAILEKNEQKTGYIPIDEIYQIHPLEEYISSDIVENCPEYFQRVYKINSGIKFISDTKDKIKELLEKQFRQ